MSQYRVSQLSCNMGKSDIWPPEMRRFGIRRQEGHSSIEMVAGFIVMIPVVFLLVDLGVFVVGYMINADMAQKTARAAAAVADGPAAVKAAENAVADMSKGDRLISISLACLKWQPPTSAVAPASLGTLPDGVPEPSPGQVLAVTTVTVRLPAPLPMLPGAHKFSAVSTQPIVGVGATLPPD